MPICALCRRVVEKVFRCPYCHKLLCENCFYKHIAWERRHEYITDESKIWKLRRRIIKLTRLHVA